MFGWPQQLLTLVSIKLKFPGAIRMQINSSAVVPSQGKIHQAGELRPVLTILPKLPRHQALYLQCINTLSSSSWKRDGWGALLDHAGTSEFNLQTGFCNFSDNCERFQLRFQLVQVQKYLIMLIKLLSLLCNFTMCNKMKSVSLKYACN